MGGCSIKQALFWLLVLKDSPHPAAFFWRMLRCIETLLGYGIDGPQSGADFGDKEKGNPIGVTKTRLAKLHFRMF
jgi:hypothetical protein